MYGEIGENEPSDLHSEARTEVDSDVHEVDVDIVQAAGSSRPKWLIGVLGVLAAGALVVGIAVIGNSADSELDVAAADEDVAEDGDDGDVVEESTPTIAAPVDEEIAVATTIGPIDSASDFASEAMMDEGYGGGPNSVVFDGEQFVTFGYSDAGTTIRTSTNGVDWDERPISGLADGHAFMLAEHDGTFVTVIEQWDSELDVELDTAFGPSDGPSYALGVSTDLENWTMTNLSFGTDEGFESSVSGVALSDAGVVILAQKYPVGPDEMGILVDAGLLTEDDFDNYCGLDITDESIVVNSCDYSDFEEPADIDMEALEQRYAQAESDEERLAIEEEFEALMGPTTTPIATITPDDPLYAELAGSYNTDYESADTGIVLAGPLDSQLALATLPGAGYAEGVVAIDGGFAVVLVDYAEAGPTSTVYTSTDGLVWAEAGAIADGLSGQLSLLGEDTLLFAGVDDRTGEPTMSRSADSGATWQTADLPVDLYGAYPMIVTGPAGAVALITGSVEPYPDYAPQDPLVVTKDGFTLTLPELFGGDGDSSATLTGPDGEVIHTFTEPDLTSSDGNIEGVLRENPLTGMPTFLDPATGEDLVTFTDEDFEDAYDGFDEDFTEPEMTTVALFSSDGVTWAEIDDDRLNVDPQSGNVNPIAVGDDELIVASNTWNSPPEELFAFEMEGREPTEEEIAALDDWYMNNNGSDSVEFFRIELG